MIEHDPWIGDRYADEGIGGQRLGIVGYSAWVHPDRADWTVHSIQSVIGNVDDWGKARFFADIPKFFGMTSQNFYPRVVFFEFVPCAIGGGDQRYAVATLEQAEAGRRRTIRIAQEHSIDKLLVFSSKAVAAMSPLMADGWAGRLGDTNFKIGAIDLGARKTTVIGLRHTQYAPSKGMREAVAQALALPLLR